MGRKRKKERTDLGQKAEMIAEMFGVLKKHKVKYQYSGIEIQNSRQVERSRQSQMSFVDFFLLGLYRMFQEKLSLHNEETE